MTKSIAGLLVLLAAGHPAQAQSLEQLLKKGPLVLVETDKKSRFRKATAIVLIDAPVERVWNFVTDYPNYKVFMPKVVKSKVTKREGNKIYIDFEIEVPGINTKYSVLHELYKDKWEVKGEQTAGDIPDSEWSWRLVPYAEGRTIAYYTGATRNFSTIAQKLEDDQQTITVGINVTSVLAAVKAIKRISESH